MRTTIELSDDHRITLHSLAARRGLRGYSKLMQEQISSLTFLMAIHQKQKW